MRFHFPQQSPESLGIVGLLLRDGFHLFDRIEQSMIGFVSLHGADHLFTHIVC
jgi:hypothetical protein